MKTYSILDNGNSAHIADGTHGRALDLAPAHHLLVRCAGVIPTKPEVLAVAILQHATRGNDLFALDFYREFVEKWVIDMINGKRVTFEELVHWTAEVVL